MFLKTDFQNLANLTSDAINFTIQATTGLLNDMIKNGTSSISTSVQSAYATESIISTTMRATNSIGRTIAQNFSHQ